jgi:hypothetical protein
LLSIDGVTPLHRLPHVRCSGSSAHSGNSGDPDPENAEVDDNEVDDEPFSIDDLKGVFYKCILDLSPGHNNNDALADTA